MGKAEAILTALGYPGHGKPCTHCGLCCKAELCDLACAIFGPDDFTSDFVPTRLPGPCPALEPDGDIFHCGLMDHPERYVPELARLVTVATLQASAKYLMGAGRGCDMKVHGEPVDEIYEAASVKRTRDQRPIAQAASMCWGLKLGPLP